MTPQLNERPSASGIFRLIVVITDLVGKGQRDRRNHPTRGGEDFRNMTEHTYGKD